MRVFMYREMYDVPYFVLCLFASSNCQLATKLGIAQMGSVTVKVFRWLENSYFRISRTLKRNYAPAVIVKSR